MRTGPWKLLEYFEDSRQELYDLQADPGEQTDLALRLPDKTRELGARLDAWRKEVGAQLPSANLPAPAPAD